MVSVVSSSLQNQGIYASKEWVEQCFAFVRESDPSANNNRLCEMVKQQYYNADIREEGVQAKGKNVIIKYLAFYNRSFDYFQVNWNKLGSTKRHLDS